MEALTGLALLACPIMMGVMIWLMARRTGGRRASHPVNSSLPDLRAERVRPGQDLEQPEDERTASGAR